MTARIGPGGPGGPVFGYHGNGLLSFLYGDFYFAVIDDNPIVTSTSYDWVVNWVKFFPVDINPVESALVQCFKNLNKLSTTLQKGNACSAAGVS